MNILTLNLENGRYAVEEGEAIFVGEKPEELPRPYDRRDVRTWTGTHFVTCRHIDEAFPFTESRRQAQRDHLRVYAVGSVLFCLHPESGEDERRNRSLEMDGLLAGEFGAELRDAVLAMPHPRPGAAIDSLLIIPGAFGSLLAELCKRWGLYMGDAE